MKCDPPLLLQEEMYGTRHYRKNQDRPADQHYRPLKGSATEVGDIHTCRRGLQGW